MTNTKQNYTYYGDPHEVIKTFNNNVLMDFNSFSPVFKKERDSYKSRISNEGRFRVPIAKLSSEYESSVASFVSVWDKSQVIDEDGNTATYLFFSHFLVEFKPFDNLPAWDIPLNFEGYQFNDVQSFRADVQKVLSGIMEATRFA